MGQTFWLLPIALAWTFGISGFWLWMFKGACW